MYDIILYTIAKILLYMKYTQTYHNTPWIDLHKPTRDEIYEIIQTYQLDSSIANELTSTRSKDTVELFDTALLITFHFPAFQHTHAKGAYFQKITFIITERAIITVRYDTIDALHKFAKMIETATILRRGQELEHGPSQLFFALMKKLYKSIFHEIEYIENWIDRIEQNIFNGNERNMVYEISNANARLLNIKKSIHLHNDLYESITQGGTHLFGTSFRNGITDIQKEYKKLNQTITTTLEQIDEYRNTNNSLLSTKRNETMQTLTVLANIAFPVTVVASIFSMNTKQSMPILGHQNDFWIILTLMATIILLLSVIFKYKEWI